MNDDQRWQAVLDRDREQDGRFLYGVTSTGVFCRPSCPSRRPRRERVRFYADAQAAAADGLRPCLRCRPLTDGGADRDIDAMVALCRLIEDDADAVTDLDSLAKRVGMGRFQLQRRFKRLLGLTPKQYVDAVRLRRVRRGLREQSSVTDAIYAAGYGSGSRLYERAAAHLGMSPGQYRAGGAGVTISWAGAETSLGRVLIGASDRGLCFVQFGEDDTALRAQLAREFPAADLVPMPASARPQLDAWMRVLAAHLRGDPAAPQLPLDLRGTAFQMRVWSFLQQIPRGSVLSYGDVARAIDAPAATRAVASACARNRVAVLVPCHRVIRGDGGMGGYRWGLARKRALLDAERGGG